MNAVKKIEKILTSKFSISNYVDFLKEIFSNIKFIAPNKMEKEFSNFSSHIEASAHIGNYITPEDEIITLFAVQLKNKGYVKNSRSTQRSYAKKIIENANSEAAIIAFFTENDSKWRLSFVRLDYEMQIKEGKLKTIENITPAKRYSYLVGEEEPCHTAIDRMRKFIMDNDSKPTLNELEEAFSVEKVTIEFFDLYCEKFHQIRKHLESNEDFVSEAKLHNYTSEQFTKKLMGQIVFLYFLQKKGWLGVKAWPSTMNEREYKNAYYARGKKSKQLIPFLYKIGEDGLYHLSGKALNSLDDKDEEELALCVKGRPWGTGPQNFMRRLFNLAKKKKQNFFDDYLEPLFYDALNKNRGEQGYCPALHCRIPFLSGGLFEPIDGYDWQNNKFNIPNEIFSNKKDEHDREGDGLLDIFDSYNFTICEDEPMEKEVAIDPEMLGKVFENLLEINEKKSKGAVYTPREIVHYMCQESLINYLSSNMDIKEDDIRDFILYGDFMKDEDTVKEKREGNGDMYISESLFKIDDKGNIVVNKLNKMDNLLKDIRIVDPAVGSGAFPLGMLNEIVRARQNISAYMAINMNSFDIRMMYNLDRSSYSLKYETIKNCIFAADIDPSAVDIAQLRLWLSLVIDDEINPNASSILEGHKNPMPLPNLECNILCGNSLVDEFNGIPLVNQSEIINNTYNNQQQNIFQIGFDTILSKLIGEQERLFKCDDPIKKKEILHNINGLKDSIVISQLKGIASDEILEEYRHTKQMASKPYVLWQLDFAKVFLEKGGFDIVIGNPPYIKEMNNKDVFDIVNKSSLGKKYHDGKMDFWYYFLHKAIEIKSETGIISYITPSYWINSKGAYKLIKRISETLDFVHVVDIGNLKVFDNVVGYHMIAIYKDKKICTDDKFVYKKLNNSLNDINKSFDTENVNIKILSNKSIINDKFQISFENSDVDFSVYDNLGMFYDISQGVVEAIDKISKNVLKKYPNDDIKLGEGIFVLNKKELNTLMLNKKELSIIKKYLNGSEVKRYKINDKYEYLIYSDKESKEYIANDNDFINIKNHLDKYKKYITSSNSPYGIHRPRKVKFFENEKLIFKSMFKKPEIALDNKDYYVGMSCSTIIAKNPKYSLKALLGVLNSNLALYWFYKNGKKRGIGVDIGVQKLREFPMFEYDQLKIEELEKRVNEIMKIYKNKDIYDMDLESYINKLVYDLYKLSSKDILEIEEFCKNI